MHYLYECRSEHTAAAAARNINAALEEDFAKKAQLASGSKGFPLKMNVSKMKTEVGRHHSLMTTKSKSRWKHIHVKLRENRHAFKG
ncbi:unnamed protein product [Heligmosomoides polygyrus]|uniref:SCP domain-containing protein n=1 Tax=Heligmosomoides polygyrus TaxID=6339 RepID=A0A183FK52_HELPZ|nr:unnamed protein product [Heligmosomoides polygyrus]